MTAILAPWTTYRARSAPLWHHRAVLRLLALVIGLGFVLGSSDANAQVFKPRGGGKAPAKTAPVKKAAPDKTDKADKPVASRKKTAPSSRKATKGSANSRASKGKGRPDDLTPDAKKDQEDVVIVVDEDED
jgi:hypothetical protein